MTNEPNGFQRFSWWIAGADPELLAGPQMPRSQGIKYSAIGLAICATTILAMGAWLHQGLLIFVNSPYRIPLALALAAAMGAVMFFLERLLIISLGAGMRPPAKLVAFSWRSVIALMNATIVALPIVLAYFQSEIVLQLDGEKLSLMQGKRDQVEDIYGLTRISAKVDTLGVAMAENRAAREQLPGNVMEFNRLKTVCDTENTALRGTLNRRIATATAERTNLNGQLNIESAISPATLRSRIASLTSQIAGWRRQLTAKQQACTVLLRQFETARNDYYSARDKEYADITGQRQEQQNELRAQTLSARATLASSDAAVVERSIPDLGARVRTLVGHLRSDHIAAGVSLAFLGFFWMLDLLPIISKLTSRASSPYERAILTQERKLAAQIDADLVETEARAAIRIDRINAERAGYKQFYSESQAKAFVDIARHRTERDEEESRMSTGSIRTVRLLIQEFEDVQARLDDLEVRYRGSANALSVVQELRSLLSDRMRKTVRTEQQTMRDAAE